MLDVPHKSKRRVAVSVEALLLRREDAARALGVSARTLDLWVKRGLVRRLRIPGSDRPNDKGGGRAEVGLFAVADLREFVEKLRSEHRGTKRAIG